MFKEQLDLAIEDGYSRLLCPCNGAETRNALTEKAEDHAIRVFAKNLRNLLMQSPRRRQNRLRYRSRFQNRVKDSSGGSYRQTPSDCRHISTSPPQGLRDEAKRIIRELVSKHSVNVIAIGNGTASRETEAFISDFIKDSAMSSAM